MTAGHQIVIGGSRGIGRSLVDILCERGHPTTVVSRAPPAQPLPASASHLACDVTDCERLLAQVQEAAAARGPIEGVTFVQRFRGRSDAWEGELSTSLEGTRMLIEALGSSLERTGATSVVVVSSNAAFSIGSDQPVSYHVAKAALDHLVRYFAVTLGRRGIRVNGVAPCAVIREHPAPPAGGTLAVEELYARICPLGRAGTSREIARVIAFLLSPDSSFLTGQILIVDGGTSLVRHDDLARSLLGPGT